jgi:3-oxoadipate enol-lactonase
MSAPITGTVTAADGTSIAYQVEGAEGAPWIVLSNSLATDRRVWDLQMEGLLSRYRVLRYDARGHGQSGPGTAPYRFTDMVGDVLALLDALNIVRADFMGVSLGGMTGLALALQAPDRLGKLVCCDARADAPAPYQAIWDANLARLADIGIAGLAAPTMERWFTESYRLALANAPVLATVREMILATSPTGYEGAAHLLQSLDLLDHLPSITCPVLYITGEHDPAAPVAVMQAMADKTPGASLTVLPDAAHLSNMEQPAAFLQAIRGFLSLSA